MENQSATPAANDPSLDEKNSEVAEEASPKPVKRVGRPRGSKNKDPKIAAGSSSSSDGASSSAAAASTPSSRKRKSTDNAASTVPSALDEENEALEKYANISGPIRAAIIASILSHKDASARATWPKAAMMSFGLAIRPFRGEVQDLSTKKDGKNTFFKPSNEVKKKGMQKTFAAYTLDQWKLLQEGAEPHFYTMAQMTTRFNNYKRVFRTACNLKNKVTGRAATGDEQVDDDDEGEAAAAPSSSSSSSPSDSTNKVNKLTPAAILAQAEALVDMPDLYDVWFAVFEDNPTVVITASIDSAKAQTVEITEEEKSAVVKATAELVAKGEARSAAASSSSAGSRPSRASAPKKFEDLEKEKEAGRNQRAKMLSATVADAIKFGAAIMFEGMTGRKYNFEEPAKPAADDDDDFFDRDINGVKE